MEECRNMSVKEIQDALDKAEASMVDILTDLLGYYPPGIAVGMVEWARGILRLSLSAKLDKAEFGDRLASIEERRLRGIEEVRENVLGKRK